MKKRESAFNWKTDVANVLLNANFVVDLLKFAGHAIHLAARAVAHLLTCHF